MQHTASATMAVIGWTDGEHDDPHVVVAGEGSSGADDPTKRKLIKRVATDAGVAKLVAAATVWAEFAASAGALARDEDVEASGLGRFTREEQTVREDRNSCACEPIAIGPSWGVSVKAGRALRDAPN